MWHLVFFLTLLYLPLMASEPLLVAVLMVKNEAHCIEKTLEPLADGGINDFFILDTGSTDGTPEIIKSLSLAGESTTPESPVGDQPLMFCDS